MDLIDDKYINLLSTHVERLIKKNSNLYNCRCIICGDSQRNKSKTRGYFYSVKNNTNYKCHNCGVNISLNNFLKQIDPILHQQYCLEKFKNGHTGKNFVVEEPKIEFKIPTFKKSIDLPKASENSKSKFYLENRGINPTRFFYAENFKTWVNTLQHIFDDTSIEESRIIIPLYFKKELIGIQGRSIKYNQVKYITVMLNDTAPKIYGYDDVNLELPVYVLEGPFDSEFVNNSIAMCGADANLFNLNIKHPIYVYDNEPRNVDIHNRMIRKIENGESIVIWPSIIRDKDVNDMILAGHKIQSVLESNTYSGLEATLKFNEWKRK